MNKPTRKAVFTSFLLFSTAWAQQGPVRGEMDSAPKETSLAGKEVVLPMIRQYHHPRVDATINGQGPFRFVIDTGAPGLTVSREVANSLNLPSPPDTPPGVEVRVSSGKGQGIPARLAWTDSLKLGGAEFKGVRTVALDLPGRDHDGVIGANIFRELLLTLDYAEGRIILTKGELPQPNGRDILSFTQPRQQGSHPVVDLEVCGQPRPFVLDSGMSGWFRVNPEIMQSCQYTAGPVPGPSARTVDSKIATQFGRSSGDFVLGGYTFQSPIVMVESDSTPLIGGAALANFRVTLDQKNMRIRFSRQDSAPIPSPPMRILGIGLRTHENGLEVWEVMELSPAAKMGVKEGDVVTSIDGRPAGEIYASEQWQRALDKASVAVTLIRNGETIRLSIPVWELVP